MADQEEGVPIPNPPPNQQQQNQNQAGQQVVHLNWSNFKQEFSGKTDEDAEAHLLCSNDWINTHHFAEGVKVRGFVLHHWEKLEYGTICQNL